MLDFSELAETPLEGLDEAMDGWQEQPEFPPPPPPGKKRGVISKINYEQSKQRDDGNVTLVFDLEIRGGEEDGRSIPFMRASSKLYDRGGSRTSQLIDVLQSAGINTGVRTVKDIVEAVKALSDQGRLVHFQLDWQGYCTTCAKEKAVELTGEFDSTEAFKVLTPEHRKEVGKYATVYKGYRKFPDVNGVKQGSGVCSNDPNHDDVQARANITRWLKPF